MLEQLGRLLWVDRPALTGQADAGQSHLRPGVAPLRGFAIVVGGALKVDRYAEALEVDVTETELGAGNALLSRPLIPVPRLSNVRFAAATLAVHLGHDQLCFGFSSFGGAEDPAVRPFGVLRYRDAVREHGIRRMLRAVADMILRRPQPFRNRRMSAGPIKIGQPELELRFEMACFRRGVVPGHRIGRASQHAFTTGIENADTVAGLSRALLACKLPDAQRLQRLALLVIRDAALHQRLRIAPIEGRQASDRQYPGRQNSREQRRHHGDQGSRIASLKPRAAPRSMYMATERVPTLISAVIVMPGMSRKFSGTFLKLVRSTVQRSL